VGREATSATLRRRGQDDAGDHPGSKEDVHRQIERRTTDATAMIQIRQELVSPFRAGAVEICPACEEPISAPDPRRVAIRVTQSITFLMHEECYHEFADLLIRFNACTAEVDPGRTH
jgi:hypothetical protein